MKILEKLTAALSGLSSFGVSQKADDISFLESEIANWKRFTRNVQIKGYMYYSGRHDILWHGRTAIGEDGKPEPVKNIPDNRIVDNQYAKMVKQKAGYLLGKPFVVDTPNAAYLDALNKIFDKRFRRTLKRACIAMLNGGIAWLFPCFNENSELIFRLIPGYEILPFWADNEHTRLDCAVRVYEVVEYDQYNTPQIREHVEVYTNSGVSYYRLDNDHLHPEKELSPYITIGKKAYNWNRIPLIALKYGETETPLLNHVKSLQDAINTMLSGFENNMQEDSRNTILVIKNYEGEDLGTFRQNLTKYGAVKVRYDGEVKGGVETLKIEVNSENYKQILELLKKSLIENAMGYDAKDDRLSGSPNQMNIQSMYTDIDLDADDMETEFQAAFDDILFFVNSYLANAGVGSFENEEVTFTFNRDMMFSESDIIQSCRNSVGILSKQTIVEQHPWVDDLQKEIDRIKGEEEEQRKQFENEEYGGAFGNRENNEEAGADEV